MNKIEKLQVSLHSAIKDIVLEFSRKHELEFTHYVEYIETAFFDDGYYFKFSDICFDVFTEQDKGLIISYFQNAQENEIMHLDYELYSQLNQLNNGQL